MRLNLLLTFIGLGVFMLASQKAIAPRGIRNNNAGNLEKNGIEWVGLSSVQSDPRFYQFTEPKWGIRALARVLKTYESKYGINTVEGILNRWAPEFENNTDAYISHVSSILGVQPDQPFSVSQNLVPLTEAIILHENGVNPYSMEQIVEGVLLA